MPERHIMAHATFCDDVREESTAKLLLIGCYRHQLFVPALPASFPLCIVLNVVAPTEPRIRMLKLQVLAGDDPIVEATPPAEQIEQAYEDVAPAPNTGLALEPLMRFDSIMRIGMASFEKPTTLRVLVITDTGELEAGRLHILQSQPAAA